MSLFSKDKLKAVQKSSKEKPKHKILIVDDEVGNLKVMASILEISYDVLTAIDGNDALSVINNLDDPRTLSMIISDQRMPKMTGVELFEKTVELMPDTLRIIVSGYSDMNSVISAINKAHIYHFITKPFERAEFLMTVKQSIKTYEFKRDMELEHAELKDNLIICKEARMLKEQQLEQAKSLLSKHNIELV